MPPAQHSLFGDEPQAPPTPKSYPHKPGAKKRETSFAAAEAMAPRAGTLREQVLEEIRRCPATPDEVAQRLKVTVLATRPRVTELSKLGLVVDSGSRRKNSSGRTAIVWRAA